MTVEMSSISCINENKKIDMPCKPPTFGYNLEYLTSKLYRALFVYLTATWSSYGESFIYVHQCANEHSGDNRSIRATVRCVKI